MGNILQMKQLEAMACHKTGNLAEPSGRDHLKGACVAHPHVWASCLMVLCEEAVHRCQHWSIGLDVSWS